MFIGRMGNIKEALKLITEQLQDVNKVAQQICHHVFGMCGDQTC